MGFARTYARTREFAVCLDADRQIFAPSGSAPPYEGVHAAMSAIVRVADVLCMSSESVPVLRAAWTQWRLPVVTAFAGKSASGTELVLTRLMSFGYQTTRTLVIGAEPQTRDCARANGVFFYPIIPGAEPECWRRLAEEALQKFLHGSYADSYQTRMFALAQSL